MKKVVRTEVRSGNNLIPFLPNVINTILGALESLLLIRVLLKLFGANETNTFVNFIYSTTAVLTRPFINIFENIELREGMVLEISTLIAMLVYALIGWIILSLFVSFTNKQVKEEIVDIE